MNPRSLLARLRLRATPVVPVHDAPVTDIDDVHEVLHWGAYGERLRLHVPAGCLVMQGALKYAGGGHPFVTALENGPDALASYYASRIPTNLCDLHGVVPAAAADGQVPAWEIPWISRRERQSPPGEQGLGPEHGLSFYGPCTPQKIRLEYRRLEEVSLSIRRAGYRPDAHGDADGYFLLDEHGDFRFFVRGGKHRIAALVHSGVKTVPVAFKRDWPRAVRLADAAHWPLVASAALSEEAARAVFKDYFR